MNKIYTFLIVLLSFEASAQNRNAIWCFGDSTGIDFSNVSNPVPFYSVMDGRGTVVSIADTAKNLLFYACTCNPELDQQGYLRLGEVFNKNNQMMQGGDSLIGLSWYKEMVIVPDPAISSRYYLFHIGVVFDYGIWYSIIDMNQNGGLGQVIQKNIPLDTNIQVDGLAAIKHGNGKDWWIINKRNTYMNDTIETFFINSSGISGPYFQKIGPSSSTNIWVHRFSPDGTMIMVLDGSGFLALYDFDRCTGTLSNENIILSENSGLYLWDGEFSENGKVFYATSVNNGINSDESYLYQFDLTAANIASTKKTITSIKTPPVTLGMLERGLDNKIYVGAAYENDTIFNYPYPDSMRNYMNENLSVINDPDNLDSACNFAPFSFYLGGRRTYYGLPNNPNYEMGPLIGSLCDTLTAIQEMNNEGLQLTIYPNPAKYALQIMAKGASNRIKEVVVRDVLGKEVLRKQSENLSAYFNINVAALNEGVYFLETYTQEGTVTIKFVKIQSEN